MDLKETNIDKKRKIFLKCLRENSREKLTSISKRTKIPISTLYDFMKEFKRSGVIRKNTVLVDFSLLGHNCHAQIFLNVEYSQLEDVRLYLEACSNVNSIYKVNNRWNLIVEVFKKNVRGLDTFVEDLRKNFEIKNIEIHYLIEEIKKEGFSFNYG